MLQVARARGLKVSVLSIGAGAELQDLTSAWATICEIDDDGMIMVRPDQHVCCRSRRMRPEPAHVLDELLSQVVPEDAS